MFFFPFVFFYVICYNTYSFVVCIHICIKEKRRKRKTLTFYDCRSFKRAPWLQSTQTVLGSLNISHFKHHYNGNVAEQRNL